MSLISANKNTLICKANFSTCINLIMLLSDHLKKIILRCVFYKIPNEIKNSTFDTLISWTSPASKCLMDLSKPLKFFTAIPCEVGLSMIKL